MERVATQSERAVIFGYLYRDLYEDVVPAKSGHVRFHHPSFSEALVWVVSSIVSGILGNLAYDLVKDRAKKVIDKFKGESGTKLGSVDRLRNEHELAKLIQYLKDYQEDYISVRPDVVRQIEEEEEVHITQKRVELKGILKLTSHSKIVKKMKKVGSSAKEARKSQRKMKLKKRDFPELDK